MTRRNDKRNNRRNRQRNNRRNRQRNNNPELPEFASMLFGALLGKGVDMIAKKMAENAEEETPDIHAEGISNQDVTNINNGKASLTKCTIPMDGTAVELPIPDNLQVFIGEDGKPMIRKKIEGDEKKDIDEKDIDEKEGNPITYDDILKKLYLNKFPYRKTFNCTTLKQAKRCVAFNKLLNIAKYLNEGWEPNFKDDDSKKWSIVKDLDNYYVNYNVGTNDASVYFKSAALAEKAILLMGEDSLNDLFATDW